MDRLIDGLIDFRFDADLVIIRPAPVHPVHVWLTLALALLALSIDALGCGAAQLAGSL